MSRYGNNSSYRHRVTRLDYDWYRLFWTVDYYYENSRLRFPRGFSRDTDEAGARRFCKKHGLDFDTEVKGVARKEQAWTPKKNWSD